MGATANLTEDEEGALSQRIEEITGQQKKPKPLFHNIGRSVTGKKWLDNASDKDAIRMFSQQTGQDEIFSRLLVARGVNPSDSELVLSPTLRNAMPDPSSLQDMDVAAKLVWDHLQKDEKIGLLADYDSDGATSAAQLQFWLEKAGQDSTPIYIPHRLRDGYGPSVEGFDKLKAQGAKLVITLDCGAAAHEAIEHAKNIGLSVIVIDHHLMVENPPPSDALVNPRRADDHSGLDYLAATGVTFMFLAALSREGRARNLFGKEGKKEPDLLSLLDLVAIGTVADVVPLRGLNRAFVRQGLRQMDRQLRPGLAALARKGSRQAPFSAQDIGFMFGPRLNAAGRLAEGSFALDLLQAQNEQDACLCAARLDELNHARKEIEKQISDQAAHQLAAHPDQKILVAAGQNWHPGVVGVVAGRLAEKFARPVIIIGFDQDGIGRGSGRSIPGADLGSAVALAKAAGLLLSGGGHPMACGLKIRQAMLKPFAAFINESLTMGEKLPQLELTIDGSLSIEAITRDFVDQLEALGPYGEGWPSPQFVLQDVTPIKTQPVGDNHLRVILQQNAASGRAIAFRCADTPLGAALASATPLHLAVRLRANDWKNRRDVDIEIIDAAFA